MKRIVIGVLIVLQCSWLLAGGVGTTGANYLKIGLGAKATALGENFTALSDDTSSLYWNAAGLTSIKKTRLDFMQLNWVAGISAKTFFGVYPLSENDYIGGYAFLLDTPQDKETKFADTTDIEYDETGKTFKDQVSVYNFSYAHIFSEQMSIGLGVKSISEDLAGSTAKGFGMDVGLLYKNIFPQTTFGASIQNIAGVKLRTDEDLPRIISIGALYTTELWANRLNIVGDIKMPSDNDMRYGAGAEYWIANIVAGRVGYNSFSKFSMGLGVAFKDLYADYAYVPLGDLGITHRISVGYAFDTVLQKPAVSAPKAEKQLTIEETINQSFVTPAVTATPAELSIVPTTAVSVATPAVSVPITEDVFAVTPAAVPTATSVVATPTVQSTPVSASEIDF